jgi:hypothetical protein
MVSGSSERASGLATEVADQREGSDFLSAFPG